ncbi:hypothetical protein NDU88_004406 [Pleurodeles waltl]|uniref:Uncharacterized protein n=1 Tax=Pleurodeles waltl TaxID=8319 RepID=A0AAV7UH08_PLEWA|nr:hypothetical protein NDU88_004406 [Pleurodeles waltl]
MRPEAGARGWSSPKEKHKHRARSGIKPTLEQVVGERSSLIWEVTCFAVDPPEVTSDLADTDLEQEARSESADSLSGPVLTPRSADDI